MENHNKDLSIFALLKSDRRLIIVCIAGLLFSVGAGAVWFVLPTIVSKITNDIIYKVLLLSIPFFFSVFMAIPLGDLSDYVGRKKMGVLGICTLFPTSLLIAFAHDFWVFIAVGILFGIAQALLNPVSKAYVMDLAPPKYSSEYFGFLFSFIYIGVSIGPLIAGFLMGETANPDLKAITVLVFVAGILSLFTFLSLKESVKHRKSLLAGLKKVIYQDKIFVRAFKDFRQLKEIGLLIILVTLVVSIVDGIIWTFEPLYYEQLSLNPETGGLIMFLFVMPMVFFQVPAGYLADKHGKFRILAIGMVIAGTSFVTFGFDGAEVYLMLSAFFTAVGVALAQPALSGIVSDHSNKSDRGDLSGVWSAFMDIPNIAAPLIGGLIVAFSGDYGAVFWSMGIIILISVIPTVLIGKRNHV